VTRRAASASGISISNLGLSAKNQVENVHRVEVERLTQICITSEGKRDMAVQPQEIPFEEPAEEPPLEPNRFSEPGSPETPPRPAEPQPDLFPPECPPEREPRECLIPALVASRPRQTASGLFIPELQKALPFGLNQPALARGRSSLVDPQAALNPRGGHD
jgi:hypothetical protein